ncbi:MAG: hypothetical protein CVU39_22770 [Chloroflexi bacterium HGW-Chloroflexi-10]|nr:MAG: hypothetical protein CVU39_22770 [Chloroflexi bacterium HGW-Chloroflexi-10]
MDPSIWMAFITGLTAGGLSCMAVQGGLVTSSLASQIENDMALKTPKKQSKRSPKLVQPILLFLAAKLVAYSLLGLLLGALGSLFALTPLMRGILQIAIAIFMLGNALRMLNVHPFFRFFSFEPPAGLRRWIRRTSKTQDAWFSPLFLGVLAVLIPCGVTQSIMALAVSSGNPWQGMVLMFAFTLGASPVFFALTYLATRLGSMLERYFTRFVAVVLLAFGLISMDAGLTLSGFPYTVTQWVNRTNGQRAELLRFNQLEQPGVYQATALPVVSADVNIHVKNDGYYPYQSFAPAGEAIRLHLITNETRSCSRAFVIPDLGLQVLLDANGEKVVEVPAQKAGTTLNYACSMGMYTGVITFQ